jgi:hypothetical protein
MGAKKGSRNFLGYQQEMMSNTLSALKETLGEIRTSGATFTNITRLSKYVGARINIADTTLRKPPYRKLLLEHLQSQSGAAALPDDLSRITTLKSNEIGFKLEVSNLKSQVSKLEALLTKERADKSRLALAVENISSSTEMALPPPDKGGAEQVNTISAVDFECTVELLLKVINYFDGTIQVDVEAGTILDVASFDSAEPVVIAKGNLTGPFINWFNANHGGT